MEPLHQQYHQQPSLHLRPRAQVAIVVRGMPVGPFVVEEGVRDCSRLLRLRHFILVVLVVDVEGVEHRYLHVIVPWS